MNRIEASEKGIELVLLMFEESEKNGVCSAIRKNYNKEDVKEIAYHDKELFVDNLGWLLSQTRESIQGCYLKDNATAVIKYEGAYEEEIYEKEVNINADSYAAIIVDVAKAVIY